jgi:hypothetical protein
MAILKNEMVYDKYTEWFSVLIPLCAKYLEAIRLELQVMKGKSS